MASVGTSSVVSGDTTVCSRLSVSGVTVVSGSFAPNVEAASVVPSDAVVVFSAMPTIGAAAPSSVLVTVGVTVGGMSLAALSPLPRLLSVTDEDMSGEDDIVPNPNGKGTPACVAKRIASSSTTGRPIMATQPPMRRCLGAVGSTVACADGATAGVGVSCGVERGRPP